jgi:hypothetical protein
MEDQEIEPHPDFAANLLEQIFSLWVEPELERRGLPVDRSTVHKALVTFSPDQAQIPVIAMNDEAELVGSFRTTRDIKAGEPVTEDDVAEIEGIEPANIDQNNGWIAYAVLRGEGYRGGLQGLISGGTPAGPDRTPPRRASSLARASCAASRFFCALAPRNAAASSRWIRRQ